MANENDYKLNIDEDRPNTSKTERQKGTVCFVFAFIMLMTPIGSILRLFEIQDTKEIIGTIIGGIIGLLLGVGCLCAGIIARKKAKELAKKEYDNSKIY